MKKIMKTFMKRILCVAAVLCLAGIVNFPVHAQEGKIVVALGADLSAEQRATVLGLMGITEEQLAGYEVIYITNAQEHQYLDAYLDASVIGSKSLSSVMLKKGAKGSGVNVTTKNINYCTTGMYRNALLTAGVPLNEAVGIVAGTMTNIWFKEALQEATEQIMIGVPLSHPLQNCGLFPPMVYYMVRIGEEAGSTEEMLNKLADYYEEEVELAVQSLMAAMEPMIIIVLAVVVGGLIAATMAPMMKMYEALDSL